MNTAPNLARHTQRSKPYTILIVDDDPIQLKLACLRLVDAGFQVEAAQRAEEALDKARREPPDAILSDVLMPELDGFGLCRRFRDDPSLVRVPVVLASSHSHSEADRELASRVGASLLIVRTPDFTNEIEALRISLAESQPPRPEAADAALYERHLRTNANQITALLGQAKNAEIRCHALFQHASDTITVLSPDGVILEANERWAEILGVRPEQLIGTHIRDHSPTGHEATNVQRYLRSIEKAANRVEAVPLQRADGSVIYMEFSTTRMEIDGAQLVLAIGHDVTHEVRAGRALEAANEKYRSLVERIPDVVWTGSLDDETLLFVTPNVEALCGITEQELDAKAQEIWLQRIHVEDQPRVFQAYRRLKSHGELHDIEYRWQRRGEWVWLRDRVIAQYEKDGVRCVDGMISDITEKKQLEESFLQAQKMEAIGQLTAGIAHDFNNMMAVILANSSFLLDSLSANDPRRMDADEIHAAANRATALTRQLLTFSHRQEFKRTTIDMRSTVINLESMLGRLLSKNIELSLALSAEPGVVCVDVGKIEQVIMNLVVNARDAMPAGGKLTIETKNIEIDDSFALSHSPIAAGRYVMLTVSDTGCGMDTATMRRIFEPFFTTKAADKGTGLGLSTCYGIVKQSGGLITVDSEPGQGTVFKVYLPRAL